MKNRNLIIGMIFAVLFTIACEEDDVCVGEGTPYLTVVFKNTIDNTNLTDSITIQKLLSDGQTVDTTLYDRALTDSIKLPLGGLNETRSYFSIKRKLNGTPDILTIDYNTKSTYVSKACGFRVTYENLDYQSTENDIQNLVSGESNTLENESATNLFIYYSPF